MVLCCYMTSCSPTGPHAVTTVWQLWFEVLLECSLFGLHRNVLRGWNFNSDHEQKKVVHAWIVAWLETCSLKEYRNCAVLDQVFWDAQGLCWKMAHLQVLYCCCFHVNKYIWKFFTFIFSVWWFVASGSLDDLRYG